MKKLCFVLALVALMPLSQAQTWKLGATFGAPAADASDVSSFVLGIDGYYYFTDIDDFINIGVTLGYRNFFGKDIDLGNLPSVETRVARASVKVDDQQFLPLAAAGRLKIFGIVGAGADLGYAFGLTDGLDGGFYFRPVATLDVLDILEINISYENISHKATWGNFNIGALLQF